MSLVHETKALVVSIQRAMGRSPRSPCLRPARYGDRCGLRPRQDGLTAPPGLSKRSLFAKGGRFAELEARQASLAERPALPHNSVAMPELALAALLPSGLSPLVAFGLIGTSALTSALTAAFGIGGGLLLLAIMAPVLPPAALVPVHGLVQLGSNSGRALLLVRQVDLGKLAWFLPGASLGVALGGLVVVDLPPAALRATVGGFILWSVWGRVRLPGSAHGGAVLAVGAISSLLTMFVGATGPFVVSGLRPTGLPKESLVATTAVAMVAQHGLKGVAFGFLGFAFAEWLPLVGAMVVSGFLGTVLGTHLLRRLREDVFESALRWILTLIALRLLFDAASSVVRP